MKKEKEILPVSNKLNSAIKLLEEKISREYGVSIDEIKEKTIIINNGNLKLIDENHVEI